jgi:hypothetical protein
MDETEAPDVGPLHNYDLPCFYAELLNNQQIIANAKGDIAEIEAELARRFAPGLTMKLGRDGKQSGTTSTEVEGFKVKGAISKTVKWDEKALQKIAAEMPSLEEIEHYMRIKFSVPESIYKAIPPGDLRDAVDAARVTKYSEMRISLEPVE